jgi:ribosomal protein S18 acetylase RimI-like enzyme
MSCSALIRAAREEDVDGLASLYVRTLRDAYAGAMPTEFSDPVSEHERASKLRSTILAGTRTWLIAVAEHEIVGACALADARDSDLPPNFGEITTVAVAEAHRRHGHGLALLKSARSLALRRAWRCIVLWVVQSNVGARGFYARADFVPDGSAKVDERLGFTAPVVRYRSTIVAPR